RETFAATVTRAIFDSQVASLDVSELSQSLAKGVEIGGIERRRCRLQHAEAPNFFLCLRDASERQHRDVTGDTEDERPPVHHRIALSTRRSRAIRSHRQVTGVS